MRLPQNFLQEVLTAAEEQFPQECCGFLIRSLDLPDKTRHRRMRNAQDDLHARDPKTFSRTARQAYAMDAAELLQVHKELRKNKERIDVIYHSHPEHEAYFSEEDHRLALDDQGEPLYAGVSYLVVSVKSGRAVDWKLYCWDPEKKEFRV